MAQPLADHSQHIIADLMSEAVVDVLEMIEIEIGDDRALPGFADGQHVIDLFEHAAVIGETSELVELFEAAGAPVAVA